MRFVTVVFAMVFALSVTSVYTQGRGNGQAKKTTVSAPKATSTKTAKQTTKATTKAAKAETRVAKADTRAAKATVKAETRAARAETKAARKSGVTTTTTTTETTENSVAPTAAKGRKLNPEQLAQLPAGMTVEAAAAGFKNWGQFVAATNASRNHGIPFEQLKAAMTGIAPGATVATTAPMSLGQAVQSLKGTTTTPTTTTTATTATPTTPLP